MSATGRALPQEIARSQRIAQRALRWSAEGEVSVGVKVCDIRRGMDVGNLQYLSGNEKGLRDLASP
jgi:hypothetical protein